MEITFEFKKFVEQKKKILNVKSKIQRPKMSRYISWASEYVNFIQINFRKKNWKN